MQKSFYVRMVIRYEYINNTHRLQNVRKMCIRDSPWNRIQLQDAMSRHRGAKPRRRCELLGEISLLSPG